MAAAVLLALSMSHSTDARADGAFAHWAVRTIVVRDETGFADYHRAIEQAVNQWNAAGSSVRLELANGRGRGCDNPEGAEIPICRHDLSGSTGGETRPQVARDHIQAASILLDASPHRFDELAAIACHELGHALGLAHNTRPTSCLTATVQSTTPDDQDRSALRAAYSHTDEPADAGDSCGGTTLVRTGAICVAAPSVATA